MSTQSVLRHPWTRVAIAVALALGGVGTTIHRLLAGDVPLAILSIFFSLFFVGMAVKQFRKT